jgi:hypothetical protein
VILLPPTPLLDCHAVSPAGRGAHERAAGGPRSIVGATQRPPAKGLRTGVRENGTRWMYAVKRRSARGTWRATSGFGIGSNLGRRKERRWRRKRHPGPGTRPEGTRAGLVMSHIVAANGSAPITALGKTAAHRLSLRSEKRDSALGVPWSRVRISWDHRRPLPPRLAAPLTHAFRYYRASALVFPAGPPESGGAFRC